MNINDKAKKEFDSISCELMAWLRQNTHPHCTVIVTPMNAELLEGHRSIMAEETEDQALEMPGFEGTQEQLSALTTYR